MDTPWLFPAPARRSRFTAGDPRFSHLNVEVGPVSPYGFDPGETSVLHYDYQTLLDHNAPGRLGAGRAGIHAGYYLKGVGRTPAAANWNNPDDRYHATGHLSPGSALRERLITLVLLQEGLGDSIVPCEESRFGSLTPSEQAFVATGVSSSRPERTCDRHLMALSVKPANFARFSNLVWALNHHSSTPAGLGRLFLALERAFAPPADADPMEGEPSDIARRMDQSFHRGLQHFRAYARIGLSWIYLQNNFTADGRFVDLETPLFVGAPLIGMRHYHTEDAPACSLLGFEQFGFVHQWRAFLGWFQQRIRLLNQPVLLRESACRTYLRALSAEIRKVFSRDHLLYQEEPLVEGVVQTMEERALSSRATQELRELTRRVFANAVLGKNLEFRTDTWRTVNLPVDCPTVEPLKLTIPPWLLPEASTVAQRYAEQFQSLSQHTEPDPLAQALQTVAASYTRATSTRASL